MKRICTLIFAAMFVLSLTACGKSYSHQFDEDFPKGIYFGMSENEIANIIGENYENISSFEDSVVMEYPGGDIYRLQDNKLTSLFVSMSESSALEILSKYGDPNKENKKLGFYFWYGTVNGVKCYMSYQDDRHISGIGFGLEE